MDDDRLFGPFTIRADRPRAHANWFPSARPWLALLLALVACLTPLLVGLGESETTSMEKLALVISQETWMRQHAGESGAWLRPSFNGKTRVTKPPMLVWLHFLAWADLDPANSTPDQLMLRARLVSVPLAIVLLVSTAWLGLTLGDLQLAVLALLIAGSNVLLRHQARFASYDIHLAAWATLSVASALWAMRPFGETPTIGRQVFGWGFAAMALALAWLSKGPLALAIVGLPVVAAIAIVPGRRVASAIGLSASVLLSAALALPWYVYIWNGVADIGGILQSDYVHAFTQKPQPFYYYLSLFALVFPWTLWLAAGLASPFRRGGGEVRRRELVPWCWFVLLFVLFSLATNKAERYILPIVPAFALATALAWRPQQDRPDQGERTTTVGRLGRIHWAVLIVTSLASGPFALSQDWLIARGWLSHAAVPSMGWMATIASTAMLIAIVIQGVIWHRQGNSLLAGLATAAWTLVGMTVLGSGSEPSTNQPLKAAAERVSRLVGAAPVRYLRIENCVAERPDMQFLFYARRSIPAIEPNEIPDYVSGVSRVFVLAADSARCDETLCEAGFRAVAEFQDGRESRRLWEHDSEP